MTSEKEIFERAFEPVAFAAQISDHVRAEIATTSNGWSWSLQVRHSPEELFATVCWGVSEERNQAQGAALAAYSRAFPGIITQTESELVERLGEAYSTISALKAKLEETKKRMVKVEQRLVEQAPRYFVMGTVGEYSDTRVWPVGAFADRDSAEKLAEKCNALMKLWLRNREDLWDYDGDRPEALKAMKEIPGNEHLLTALSRAYGADWATYHVVEIGKDGRMSYEGRMSYDL